MTICWSVFFPKDIGTHVFAPPGPHPILIHNGNVFFSDGGGRLPQPKNKNKKTTKQKKRKTHKTPLHLKKGAQTFLRTLCFFLFFLVFLEVFGLLVVLVADKSFRSQKSKKLEENQKKQKNLKNQKNQCL